MEGETSPVVEAESVCVESDDKLFEPQSKRPKLEADSNHVERKDSSGIDAKDAVEAEVIPFARKKKVALLVSYCGAGYFGMQKNPDVNTIEEELLNALWKAGGIKEDVKDDLAKLSFQRCARTDKGVSAARQVVSLKHMIPEDRIIKMANENLPPEIRVMGMKRVTRGFDCKLSCAARTYEYLVPTFAFARMSHETRVDYRLSDAALVCVREVLDCYKGTHNFHNFTSGRLPSDPSAMRYIMEFTAGEPFLRGTYEFMCLSVTGQSFMLHQIRKMIGLCIAICKGFCSKDKIAESWQPGKLDIPRAPGLGLVLDKVHYTGYNKRYGNDGIHQPITWDENEADVVAFKEEFIWRAIVNTEASERPMMRWLSTLKCHTYTNERTMLPGGQGSVSTESDVQATEQTNADDKVNSTTGDGT